MISVQVPHETPFVHQDNGITVFAVSSDAGPCGVYYSLQRAIQYIDDWMKPLENEGGFVKPDQSGQELTGPDCWDYGGYSIEKTFLRC
jgi:hypothetical protein